MDDDLFSDAKSRLRPCTLRNRLKHDRLIPASPPILRDFNIDHEKMLGRQFHPVFLDVLMVCFIGSLQVSLSSYFLVTYLTKFDTDVFQTEGVLMLVCISCPF